MAKVAHGLALRVAREVVEVDDVGIAGRRVAQRVMAWEEAVRRAVGEQRLLERRIPNLWLDYLEKSS